MTLGIDAWITLAVTAVLLIALVLELRDSSGCEFEQEACAIVLKTNRPGGVEIECAGA